LGFGVWGARGGLQAGFVTEAVCPFQVFCATLLTIHGMERLSD